MTAALVDLFCRSFPIPPAAVTLDIYDTCDAVHGHQRVSLFHAHCEMGWLPAGARPPYREREAGGGSPAARQGALGGRGPHPAEAPDPPHPPSLAAHPAHVPGGMSRHSQTIGDHC